MQAVARLLFVNCARGSVKQFLREAVGGGLLRSGFKDTFATGVYKYNTVCF